MSRASKKVMGGRNLPADADVDFVLHAPGRDYDFVEFVELDDDDLDDLGPVHAFDEEATTGVYDAEPTPKPAAPAMPEDTPWWKAARQGLRARSSDAEAEHAELSWWEAARMGLRAPTHDE